MLLLINVERFYKSILNVLITIILVITTYLPIGILAGIFGEIIISKISYIVYIYPGILILLGIGLFFGKFFKYSISLNVKSIYLMIPIISLSIATSCSLPLFLASFILSSSSGTLVGAIISIMYYALGLSVTLILLTFLVRFFGKTFLYRLDFSKVQKFSGLILIVLGIVLYLKYLALF